MFRYNIQSYPSEPVSILSLYLSPVYSICREELSILKEELETYDPMEVFTYALKSPESRRQYPRRFKPFLNFLRLEGSLNQQAKQFWLKARLDPRWVEDNLMQFIRYQKDRARSLSKLISELA